MEKGKIFPCNLRLQIFYFGRSTMNAKPFPENWNEDWGMRMSDQENNTAKIDALGREVLTLSRNTLLVNLRFLDAALSQFAFAPRPGSALSTDGRTLYYDPRGVLRAYREEHAATPRACLHLVLHCVFRHMFGPKRAQPEVWELACDIAVEHAISALGLTAVSVEREKQQQVICERIGREIGMLTAEKLYRYLLGRPYWLTEQGDVEALFRADDHALWFRQEEHTASAAEGRWRDISRRMQVDIETFARRQGDRAAAILQNLREVNRESSDYVGFLHRFAARGEPMKSSPEEFDYIFYTYGMQQEQKLALIEPLEYKQVKTVREFVLAVDLCGLLTTAQAQKFLRRTYEVLQMTARPAVPVRLRLLTWNGESLRETELNDREELERYLAGMRRRERDGTDFRPVFQWMDEAVHRRVFRNLKGLIYFTDGYGPFPPVKPDFTAAFVLVNDNYSEPDVPPWAIRLVLQKDEME